MTKAYKCDICERNFFGESALEAHYTKHMQIYLRLTHKKMSNKNKIKKIRQGRI